MLMLTFSAHHMSERVLNYLIGCTNHHKEAPPYVIEHLTHSIASWCTRPRVAQDNVCASSFLLVISNFNIRYRSDEFRGGNWIARAFVNLESNRTSTHSYRTRLLPFQGINHFLLL